MKHFKSIIIVLAIVFSLLPLNGQTNSNNSPLPPKVVEAVKKGNAAELKPFLNSRVELVLPEESGIYSKEQAHFILKSFFESHKVTSFRVLHHGTRQHATYAIGEYKCPQNQYRMYFLVKEVEGKPLIHQIRIEKQD
ncbi:DUF4783 domain-containing protein [Marinilabilia rubra]|uniref:DUF4783 domain-containing protein n=1 Tax=Marinilabilia rubra TaxID=2162893 RepID=A0A2U2B4F6_9BACT|nr:DUF4783 domain-containing protein [Marinilabilia rubra]PWD97950.1 DUF4783 domain-containing protein [Marinilabilia rubra]